MPQRLDALNQWLRQELALGEYTLAPASGDASFRRYFRVATSSGTYIAMDAPPPQEDMGPFLAVSRQFLDIGLHVPEVFAADRERGFALLSDLGTRLYLQELDVGSVERLYGDALGALLVIQACGPRDAGLPPYGRERLLKEMGLFRDWLLERHLGLELTPARSALLGATFDALADSALAQPQVCVHRDFHSRNLMVTEHHNPGILDYQDAVVGPVTYDLVSLLRDCYIAWPRERVEEWALGYQELALHSGVLREEHEDEAQFLRWFDWMGVQRHLKAAGIFARLFHRDAKPGYLADIPRTVGYIVEVSGRYPELAGLGELAAEVIERLEVMNAE